MKKKAKPNKDTPETQHARFVEAAYKVEADQAKDALDKAFGKLTTAKPAGSRLRPSAKRSGS